MTSLENERQYTKENLQATIEELSELNDDMNNLLSSTHVGTVFLDRDLVIRKYTPPVTKQINLIESDLGRPFSNISNNLLYEDLIADIRAVLEEEQARETEVASKLGRWYLVKVQPYRTERDRLEGVVITLIDITERKKAEKDATRQHDLTMRILEANPSAITMVDP